MGKHEAQIDHLEKELEGVRRDLAAVRVSIDEIRSILDKADGGWRALMWVGGISGTVGASVAWFASKLHISI